MKMLCKQYNMNFEEIKGRYDGYSFSHIKSVYSSNSVIEAIKSEEIGNYWTPTEIAKLIRNSDYLLESSLSKKHTCKIEEYRK